MIRKLSCKQLGNSGPCSWVATKELPCSDRELEYLRQSKTLNHFKYVAKLASSVRRNDSPAAQRGS